jgi:hypothetical protein
MASDQNITVDIEGESELADALERIAGNLTDLSRPMDQIGSYLTDFFSGEVFASRGGVINEPWAPLSDAYAEYKAREFPGRIPLVREGQMIRGFKDNAGELSVQIFNETDWFDFIQSGTRRMPARVMMKIDQTRNDRIVSYVQDEVDRQVKL